MRPLLPICVLAALFLPACVNVHPRYPSDSVIWDASLVGDWRADGDDGQSVLLRIEPREVEVAATDGRINPDPHMPEVAVVPADVGDPIRQRSIQQYLLTYVTNDGVSWVLEAYLLESRGARFLAFQRTDPFIEDNAGWVLPVHLLWKIKRDGDAIRFWSPTDAVAWIPAIQWADAEDDGGDRPIPRRGAAASRGGIRVAESLDRVLEYHASHADDPTFWNTDDEMKFRRVPPP